MHPCLSLKWAIIYIIFRVVCIRTSSLSQFFWAGESSSWSFQRGVGDDWYPNHTHVRHTWSKPLILLLLLFFFLQLSALDSYRRSPGTHQRYAVQSTFFHDEIEKLEIREILEDMIVALEFRGRTRSCDFDNTKRCLSCVLPFLSSWGVTKGSAHHYAFETPPSKSWEMSRNLFSLKLEKGQVPLTSTIYL